MSESFFISIFENIKAVENSLTCKVCCEILDDPIVGKCGHSFCRKCINSTCGERCSFCDIVIHSKDSYEDKQLKDLLVLIQNLKSIAEHDRKLEKAKYETCDQVLCTTPLQSKTPKSSTFRKDVHSSRTSKSTGSSTLEHSASDTDASVTKNQGNILETPKNARLKRRKAFTSPAMKSLKRSPFRFTSYSAKKKVKNTLRSPKFERILFENLEKKNVKGETPLHVAVIKGDVAKVKDFLTKGAIPNVKDNAGWTPLHEASNLGHLEIAKLLVNYGANLDVPGQQNITPLHDAIMNTHFELAKFLVSRGADIYAKTALGNTAADLCKKEDEKASLIQVYNTHKEKIKKLPNVQIAPDSKEKLVFLPTGLNSTQKEQLQKCAQMLKADIVNDFSTEVTHTITSCDERGLCNRTLKIMQGILGGKWIINYNWVEMCLEFQDKVQEEPFEVPGTKQQPNANAPKRARENLLNQFPPLFSGCYFYLYGQFTSPTPPKEDIVNLIQIGGGKVLAREPKPETVSLEEHEIPYHASGGPLADISHFILYQDKPPRQNSLRASHIYIVNVLWLIECISSFELIDPDSTKLNIKYINS